MRPNDEIAQMAVCATEGEGVGRGEGVASAHVLTTVTQTRVCSFGDERFFRTWKNQDTDAPLKFLPKLIFLFF